MKSGHKRFLRDFDAGPRLDTILLAAVLSVLAIRFWLHLSGYPTLGGNSLHIAHVLWGGLLMLAGLVVSTAFLDRTALNLAAVLGGVGFGTFIDEVGKFLTHDNNYFYRPAVSIMYAVFVLVYLTGRALIHRRRASGAENLANALYGSMEIAVDDLDRRERDRVLDYLEASGDDGPLVRGLRGILAESHLVSESGPSRWRRAIARLVDGYRALAVRRWFGWALIALFSVQLSTRILRLTVLAHWLPADGTPLLRIPLVNAPPVDPADYAVAHWMQTGSSLLAAVFIGLGLAKVFRDRLGALRQFERALVVTLCLTQVFVFYHVEWLGLVELVFNLLLLAGLRYAIEWEQSWRRDRDG